MKDERELKKKYRDGKSDAMLKSLRVEGVIHQVVNRHIM